LAVDLKVDTMRQNLRTKSRNGSKRTNRDGIRTVNQVAVGDAGVITHDQARKSLGLMNEMLRRTAWVASNPIGSSNACMSSHLQEFEAFAHSEVTNSAMGRHYQFLRKDPGEANVAGAIQPVPKNSAQHPST
jgi:hypothetical protein